MFTARVVQAVKVGGLGGMFAQHGGGMGALLVLWGAPGKKTVTIANKC
jgi:hypothetical protein